MPNNRILKTMDLFACRDRGISWGGGGGGVELFSPHLKSKPESFGVVGGSVTVLAAQETRISSDE